MIYIYIDYLIEKNIKMAKETKIAVTKNPMRLRMAST